MIGSVSMQMRALVKLGESPVIYKVIAQVRAVYKGRVSVAFNGNPFFNDISRGGVPWLDALDFIGLDCYWPIYTDLGRLTHFWEVASVEEIVKAWQPTIALMANASKVRATMCR